MDKSPERSGDSGLYIIVTILENQVAVAMFMEGKELESAREIELGKMYDFLLYSVVVRGSGMKKVGARENFYAQGFSVKDIAVKLVKEQFGNYRFKVQVFSLLQ